MAQIIPAHFDLVRAFMAPAEGHLAMIADFPIAEWIAYGIRAVLRAGFLTISCPIDP